MVGFFLRSDSPFVNPCPDCWDLEETMHHLACQLAARERQWEAECRRIKMEERRKRLEFIERMRARQAEKEIKEICPTVFTPSYSKPLPPRPPKPEPKGRVIFIYHPAPQRAGMTNRHRDRRRVR